ncbi:terminase small subunit [bacterium]|nr:terminase small subunit [bacterium]
MSGTVNTINKGDLSIKQRFFVDIFEGDGAAAVLAAGYRCKSARAASAMASRLLCNPKIQKAIAQKVANLDGEFLKIREEHRKRLRELRKIKKELAGINSKVLRGHVATRRERQVFWTKTMMDKEEKMSDRLRASELLGKSELDFGEQKVTNQSFTMGVAFISNPDIREMISDITGVALPAPEIRVPEKAPVIDVTPRSDFEPELPPEELELEEAIEFTKKQHVSPPVLQYLKMSEELRNNT